MYQVRYLSDLTVHHLNLIRAERLRPIKFEGEGAAVFVPLQNKSTTLKNWLTIPNHHYRRWYDETTGNIESSKRLGGKVHLVGDDFLRN